MGPLSSVLPRLRLCLVSAGSPEMGFPERNTWPLTAPSPRGAHGSPFPTVDPQREEAGASWSLDTNVPGASGWRCSFQIRRHDTRVKILTVILQCDQGPLFLVLFLDITCSHTPLVC